MIMIRKASVKDLSRIAEIGEDDISMMITLAAVGVNADVVLWPVYTDFNYEEWNKTIKHEYAEQAARFGHCVCYVNSVCMDREGFEIARGGATYFLDGRIKYQTPAGEESILYVKM